MPFINGERTYRVKARILRDGKEYRPGDIILLTYTEAEKLEHSIVIKDRKMLLAIEQKKRYIHKADRENLLYGRADTLGVPRKEVKDGLLDKC